MKRFIMPRTAHCSNLNGMAGAGVICFHVRRIVVNFNKVVSIYKRAQNSKWRGDRV